MDTKFFSSTAGSELKGKRHYLTQNVSSIHWKIVYVDNLHNVHTLSNNHPSRSFLPGHQMLPYFESLLGIVESLQSKTLK